MQPATLALATLSVCVRYGVRTPNGYTPIVVDATAEHLMASTHVFSAASERKELVGWASWAS